MVFSFSELSSLRAVIPHGGHPPAPIVLSLISFSSLRGMGRETFKLRGEAGAFVGTELDVAAEEEVDEALEEEAESAEIMMEAEADGPLGTESAEKEAAVEANALEAEGEYEKVKRQQSNEHTRKG